jgi:hypothetical protein
MVADWQEPNSNGTVQRAGQGQQAVKDASYREDRNEFSPADHGIPVFSPLCDPAYIAALKQNESDQDLRWGVPDVPEITPAVPPHPHVFQFDDSPSAQGFSLDPSYAERSIVPSRILPQDTLSPPLALYHRLKAAELDALGSFRNIQATSKRLSYIKPGDHSW